MVIQPPAKFYAEKQVPIVRWMYPKHAYKARLITVSRKYDQALFYVYVLNDKHVIVYRNAALTMEVGMMKLEHFEKIKELPIEGTPAYKSGCPIPMTYGMLLENEPIQEDIPEVVEVAVKIEPEVKVIIMPPEPPVQYEQMKLF